VIVALYERYKERPIAWKAFKSFLVVFLLVSFFIAWRTEHEQVIHFTTELQNLTIELQKAKEQNTPNLIGSVLIYAFIPSHQNKNDLHALFTVQISNSGADSAVGGFWGKIFFGNENRDLLPTMLPDKGITVTFKGNERTFTRADLLVEKIQSPIKRGDIQRGILFFTIRDAVGGRIKTRQGGSV
jgi:hypothetical protein